METREKQNLLTMIIIVAFLAIVLIVGFIIYPEIKETKKIEAKNTQSTSIKNTESTKKTEETKTSSTEIKNTEETSGYVGKEEKEDNTDEKESEPQTKEEKAIELAKKEWGENDTNVTYNVEQKEGNIYYVAVRANDQVQKWYEIDTGKWTIREY